MDRIVCIIYFKSGQHQVVKLSFDEIERAKKLAHVDHVDICTQYTMV